MRTFSELQLNSLGKDTDAQISSDGKEALATIPSSVGKGATVEFGYCLSRYQLAYYRDNRKEVGVSVKGVGGKRDPDNKLLEN